MINTFSAYQQDYICILWVLWPDRCFHANKIKYRSVYMFVRFIFKCFPPI